MLNDINNINNNNIIDIFNTKLRFQIINELDSQDNYIGKWIDKNIELSNFENLYNEWKNISPYLGCINNNMIPNPHKQFFKEILLSCK